jgi:methionine synthase II (cobalamin-independent)
VTFSGPTTGIGSLPHRSIEAALEQSFRVDIPYLPQLPIRDPREFMLPQATEGVPGMVADDQGGVVFDLEAWKRGADAYDQRLDRALRHGELAPFLPSPEHHACWRPFLGRLREGRVSRAKIQIAGPITLQWSLRTIDGRFPPPLALGHVSRTLLARGLAMVAAVRDAGAEVVAFIDEPGLYAFSRSQPGHLVLLQELRIMLLALKKAGATVGLHCCSDADWGALLGLGLDVLAIDARLSLRPLLRASEALVAFANAGGRIALGVIPTDLRDQAAPPPAQLMAEVEGALRGAGQFPGRSAIFQHLLEPSWLTPACGLAFAGERRAEAAITDLLAFQEMSQGG